MVLEVLGHEDGGHATFADLALDIVAFAQCGAQALQRIGHDGVG
jgi:hypothetical protein